MYQNVFKYLNNLNVADLHSLLYTIKLPEFGKKKPSTQFVSTTNYFFYHAEFAFEFLCNGKLNLNPKYSLKWFSLKTTIQQICSLYF